VWCITRNSIRGSYAGVNISCSWVWRPLSGVSQRHISVQAADPAALTTPPRCARPLFMNCTGGPASACPYSTPPPSACLFLCRPSGSTLCTPLYSAAVWGYAAAVEALVKEGAMPNMRAGKPPALVTTVSCGAVTPLRRGGGLCGGVGGELSDHS
jgi:hypothetical protein